MGTLARIVGERTDLTSAEADHLARLVEEWSTIADLALSDLVLWVPTWNEAGHVAAAHVRPTTAPTAVPDDLVGSFMPRGRRPELDQAAVYGKPVVPRDPGRPGAPAALEAYPVVWAGRPIGIVGRYASVAPRVVGHLEEVYLESADDLLGMVVAGAFPVTDGDGDPRQAPRVGDGMLRLTAAGEVEYASPNATTAIRRLGLARDLVGARFADLVARLVHRPGPVDTALASVAAGRTAGSVDLENGTATVILQGIPLMREGARVGALLFCRDVTDLRRRERALVSKDATIREIHHRVKNNLQTVAAMLRLQGRRAASHETRQALSEAELRVAAIATVHESLSGMTGEAVDFDGIVDRIISLVRDLAPAYPAESGSVRIVRAGSWGELSSDLATPLAMVVSELVHNAVEHGRPSEVEVRLEQQPDGLVLAVRDDGRGLPEGFTWDDAGLGLSIVQSLVSGDLHGECSAEGADPGTAVTVRIPLATR